MENYLVKLKNGYIKSLDTDEVFSSGCPTCDFGSCYVNEFWITLSKSKIFAKTSQMYEYCFSTGEIVKRFLNKASELGNMTEDEFIEWFRTLIFEKDETAEFNVNSI